MGTVVALSGSWTKYRRAVYKLDKKTREWEKTRLYEAQPKDIIAFAGTEDESSDYRVICAKDYPFVMKNDQKLNNWAIKGDPVGEIRDGEWVFSRQEWEDYMKGSYGQEATGQA